MEYELAKQLKEAGFPDISWFSLIVNGSTDEIRYQMPALSELIEACGDKIDTIERHRKKGGWDADNGEWDNDKYICSHGDTPEEAVAKLWLELNK